MSHSKVCRLIYDYIYLYSNQCMIAYCETRNKPKIG